MVKYPLFIISLFAILIGFGGQTTARTASAETPNGPYVSLGDSLAVGVGASDPATTGYVNLFAAEAWRWLAFAGTPADRLAFGVSGETSTSISGEGGQLEHALAAIQSRRTDGDPSNDVRLITIDIGGNDFLALAKPSSPCQAGPETPDCQAAAAQALGTFGANLPVILGKLRATAGPDATILIATVYNPYSGTGTPFDAAGDTVIATLNNIILQVAGDPAIDATVADISPAFTGKAPLVTHIADPDPDIHPTDVGHAAIAEAFVTALKTAHPEALVRPPATGSGLSGVAPARSFGIAEVSFMFGTALLGATGLIAWRKRYCRE